MNTWTVITETLRSTDVARIFVPAAGQLHLHVLGCERAACLLAAGATITQKLANEAKFGTNFAQSIADRFPHEATCPCLPENLRCETSNQPPAPIVDTPEILAAVKLLRVALAQRERLQAACAEAQAARDACAFGVGSRTARKRAGDALEMFLLAGDAVYRCRGDVERTVRTANAFRGCTEPQLNAAAAHLA